ncbi:YiiX/YebB-like N1pC/P60 family cysteine hydrolase [Natronospira bacteriovora]|uniref:YiiX/YebB-like N1pC/P60 family cysteine hydrolase n=1 Tax=Natronospira bacteriovora TaxID=3069753 RepID=A0ABU0W5G7_9GAMM|nr:YiiX/YebB-like N1pC/P60 family cysteine hydrolase [Natronospira sp. AB-CW4]MDQ2069267.1 YiiX/YebB-like N1pC/P60 family cysteine hydrolase [Natronospira sp. AB-CW4]
MFSPRAWLFRRLVNWLERDVIPRSHLYSNYRRLSFEVEPGDVVLVEGRTRVSQVIKQVTQTSWTHSAIYVGRLVDIDDLEIRERIQAHFDGDATEQLLIESMLGQGTIVTPLKHYEGEHLRVCRPMGLSSQDQLGVIQFAASQLGVPYDVRQLLDLARFFLPYALFPRRWRSSLFERKAGDATRHVCSSMMAEAYSAVNFPILPFIERRPDGRMVFYKRNPRLFTPRDFDYSPYFDVLKFPYLDRGDIAAYRCLPWSESGVVYNDEADFARRLKDAMTSEETLGEAAAKSSEDGAGANEAGELVDPKQAEAASRPDPAEEKH